MTVEWLGHASFLITAANGTRILTDPYESGSFGGAVGYRRIDRECDIVTVSHEHEDHNWVKGIPGRPTVVKGTGSREVRGITFKGLPLFHDPNKGKDRGKNTVYTFGVDGVSICHLGDLGYVPSADEGVSIGKVEVLFCPVGGFYTIDARQATDVMELLKPRILLPMHYKTEVVGFPIDGVEKFLAGKKNVRTPGASSLVITRETLPKDTEVVVLEHSL